VKFINSPKNSKKMKKIQVLGSKITIHTKEKEFISLTDIAKYKNSKHPADVIKNWTRSKDTIEFLGPWEKINNSNFKLVEFDHLKNQAGTKSFVLSPKKWITKTDAIGLVSRSGNLGGTFAHKDIAFEFASWISTEFKLFLIKEYQRLQEDENKIKQLDWNIKKLTSIKLNFHCPITTFPSQSFRLNICLR
jgi:hypothetical protein